jgi:hypothetical protein
MREVFRTVIQPEVVLHTRWTSRSSSVSMSVASPSPDSTPFLKKNVHIL